MGIRGFPGGSLARGFSSASIQWPLERAGNLVALNYGKSLVEEARTIGKIPVFGTNGRCGWNGQALAKGPGVILGRKGMGPLGVEWSSDDFWVIDTAYYAVPRSAELDLKFFYYLAKYVGLNHLKDGTSNPTLSREAFYSQVVPFPPPEQQRAIAGILGALDDKIDLNRQMNETLEAMAQAMFKSWFVDFDPVCAKAEGREPAAMDPETAKLFPDSFADSSMGEIPAGWSVETVGGIADTSRESLNPQGSPEERFALFSIPAFDDGRVPALAAGSSIHSNKLLVPPGSVLVSKLNPRIPRVWRPGVFLSRGIASTEFVILTPKPECPRDVLFAIVSSQPFCERLAELVTGTSGSHQRARAEDLLQVPFAFPPPPVATSFSRIASPMFDRINANLRESQVLATIRDSLLPKMLSGEVRVSPQKATG